VRSEILGKRRAELALTATGLLEWIAARCRSEGTVAMRDAGSPEFGCDRWHAETRVNDAARFVVSATLDFVEDQPGFISVLSSQVGKGIRRHRSGAGNSGKSVRRWADLPLGLWKSGLLIRPP